MARSESRWIWLPAFVGLCLLVAAVAALSTASSVSTWYPTLKKPVWNPPNAVFGPVWTTLYIMIGIAGWLVWRVEPGEARKRALRWWIVQLVLNFLWTPLFFGLQTPGVAAIEIVLLWVAIVAFVRAAWKICIPAAVLFLPYWMWVTFATMLNFAIWWLNRI